MNIVAALDLDSIDEPIVDIVSGFVRLPYCFPLQSCFGHFVCDPEQDIHTLDPIPTHYTGPIRYRIAYIALCLENSRLGKMLHESLSDIPAVNFAYIQFGSADWFWERFVNSFILQVEPSIHREKDEVTLEAAEARQVQMARDQFFDELRNLACREFAKRSIQA